MKKQCDPARREVTTAVAAPDRTAWSRLAARIAVALDLLATFVAHALEMFSVNNPLLYA